MGKDQDISATEKLLEMIRKDQTKPPEEQVLPSLPESGLFLDLGEDVAQNASVLSETLDDIDDNDDFFSDSVTSQTLSPEAPEKPDEAVSSDKQEQQESKKSFSPFRALGNKLQQLSQTKPSSASLKVLKKELIGIDIQPEAIYVVKAQHQGATARILEQFSVNFDEPLPADADDAILTHIELRTKLQETLHRLGRRGRRTEIWLSCYAMAIETVSIIIPDLPEKDIANAVFWSAKKEQDFDAEQTIFDFTKIKTFQETNQKKLLCLAYLIPKKFIIKAKALFQGLSAPVTGITSNKTAQQNILNVIKHNAEQGEADQAAFHLSLLKETAHIDLFYKGVILFSREIKTGATSFVESLFDYAGQENQVLDGQTANDYLFHPIHPGSQQSITTTTEVVSHGLDLGQLQATGRLIRQLGRTQEYSANQFKIPRVKKLYLSGDYLLNKQLLKELHTQLELQCSYLHDDVNRHLKEKSPSLPSAFTSRQLTALGLAFSDQAATQNALFTYKERNREAISNKINHLTSFVVIIMALLTGGYFFLQYNSVKADKNILNSLQQNLNASYAREPRSRDTSYAMAALSKTANIYRQTKESLQRFSTVALLEQVMNSTPANIKLTDLNLNLGNNFQQRTDSDSARNTIVLNGYIREKSPADQKFVLLGYLKTLKGLSFVTKPEIAEERPVIYNNQAVMFFTLRMTVNTTL